MVRNGNSLKPNEVMLVAAALLINSSNAWAVSATPDQISSARANGLAWLYKNQNGDGSWSSAGGLRIFATTSVLDAFLGAGISKGTAFASGVANLVNAKAGSTDARARQISTMARAGSDVTSLMAKLKAQSIYSYGGWGPFPGYSAGIMDTAISTITMTEAAPEYTSYSSLICNFFGPGQRTGGGWSYFGQQTSSPSNASAASILPTVYSVLALQKIATVKRVASANCGATSYTLSTMLGNGVTYLKTKRNADGGYGEDGVSGILETALAYRAIAAASPGDSVLADAQGYLVAAQNSNGSWGNDAFQTALALQAFPSTALVNTSGDGMPDVVKLALGLAVSAPAPDFKPGNGQSVPGLNTPTVLIGLKLGVPTSYVVTAAGGTAPYVFTAYAGALPPGVTLAANGALSGSPTATGNFDIMIKQTDNKQAIAYRNVQIFVEAQATTTVVKAETMPASKLTLTPLLATVSGDQPYGTVQFFDAGVLLGTVTLPAGDPAITVTQTAFRLPVKLSGGFRRIKATYSGDTRNQSSVSEFVTVPVNPDAAAIIQSILQIVLD